MMNARVTLIRGIRQFFVVTIPVLYLVVIGTLAWMFWMKEDRIFALRMGNFFIQGRWESDDLLRNLTDLRVDSRYGYFPLGQIDAIVIIDEDDHSHYPEVTGYKEINSEEFEVHLSEGLQMHFFSFEDGIAIDANQSEMPYQAKEIQLNFVISSNASFMDDGMGLRLQLDAQNYAIEGDFEVSSFDLESGKVLLRWIDGVGFDRLQISSNLFGQPKAFSQWLQEFEELFSLERYDNVVQRYLSRALPYFQQRYNENNGLWRNNANQEVFNLPATLTRIWQAETEKRLPDVWLAMAQQELYRHAEFPVWLSPMSGELITKWEEAQRNFSSTERIWQGQYNNSQKLFSSSDLYTQMAIAAPLQLTRVTTLARSVQSSDSPDVIINKIYFLLAALTNQATSENLQAINRQLEALEKHLVFLKKGIYILYDDALQLESMVRYATLLKKIEEENLTISYRSTRPLVIMQKSLTMGVLDFSNANGEVPKVALWQDGRPQAGEEFIGLEEYYALFYPSYAVPQVHLASLAREQRVLSIANDVTIRTLSDTVLQLRVEYFQRQPHYMVLTSLIRPVLAVSIDGRRLTQNRNLETMTEGYFYDNTRKLLYLKTSQKIDVETIRIEIEAPPPPPPKAEEVETPEPKESAEIGPVVVPSITLPVDEKKKKR